MNGNGLGSEDRFNYGFLYCHACLISTRTLCMVGNYIDIYLKICDNVRANVTPQLALCWECMAMLKKICAFKKKVENAQKILDYGMIKKMHFQGLTYLSQSETESTTYPMDMDCDLYKSDEKIIELDSDIRQDDTDKSEKDELMIRIEDVRGNYEIEKPTELSNTSCEVDVPVKVEPVSPEPGEDEAYQGWKRAALLVFKRICSHPHAPKFLKPVSDEIAPYYSKIVRKPTDLGTIRQQIKDGVIRCTAQLERALLLMFSNALVYNCDRHAIYHIALEFRTEALRELALLSAVSERQSRPARASRDHATLKGTPSPRDVSTGCRRRKPSWGWTSFELDTELLEPSRFSKICKTVLL